MKVYQKAQRKPIPVLGFISGAHFLFAETCKRCGYMSSNELCKACTLLEGLERGMATAGVVSGRHLKREI